MFLIIILWRIKADGKVKMSIMGNLCILSIVTAV